MLETKSIAALAFNETPRKRKRETGPVAVPPLINEKVAAAAAPNASCFTNAAFSSTPKKLIARRRGQKENASINPFCGHPGLEIKSIADLATAKKPEAPSLNPFEVVRQPSKKKKHELACFENPGLNLELPERQFNPFEVVRSVATPSQCFVNEALNIKARDAPASLNPFEIRRPSDVSVAAYNPDGVDNPALAEEPFPTNLKIGLPFAPTVGCRIDFHGMSLAQLTPSKLLADKLVFSPVPPVPAKRSLGAISEESSMDIGKELDRYQLELENSINEAKLRKNGVVLERTDTEVKLVVEQQQQQQQDQEQTEKRIVCTMRRRTLTEIKEIADELPHEQEQEAEQPSTQELALAELEEGGDVAYASESEEEEEPARELDFKAPTRFVRAYRPAASSGGGGGASVNAIAGSKESLQSIASSKSSKSTEGRASQSVKQIIRKSIRRLIHPKQQQPEPEPEEEQQQHHHHNIISSIRHSLRRRPHKPQSEQEYAVADVSIVDSSERTLKLRSNIPQTEYMRIEQLTNEKKHTLRNSIRRSTRDVLRHVFHKSQDAYTTAK
ncbi:pon [Drosophila busckii]|uniref:Pon n=1 Tax=Drosophila busckii TaxID=30019 RepID=A0A0M5J6C9_DROBS|nr:uncharacterized protein LOC108605727 [Drosophila busckii]ALC49594.1 pon [Drosophila busckii]